MRMRCCRLPLVSTVKLRLRATNCSTERPASCACARQYPNTDLGLHPACTLHAAYPKYRLYMRYPKTLFWAPGQKSRLGRAMLDVQIQCT